jgi:hypothetical protein
MRNILKNKIKKEKLQTYKCCTFINVESCVALVFTSEHNMIAGIQVGVKLPGRIKPGLTKERGGAEKKLCWMK